MGRREPRPRRLPRASSTAGRWEPRPPPSCKLRRGEDGAAAAVLAPAPPRGEGSRSLQLRRGEDGAAAALTPSRKLRCCEVGAAVVALAQAPPRGRWWSSFRSFFQIARVIIAKCMGGSVFCLLPCARNFFTPRPYPNPLPSPPPPPLSPAPLLAATLCLPALRRHRLPSISPAPLGTPQPPSPPVLPVRSRGIQM
jgi:hypothetical protein